MRISKANHLKRLLQTLDVLVGTLCFLVAVNGVWISGKITLDQAVAHIQIAPFVFAICVFATATYQPKLHGETPWTLALFAGRYGLILLTGMMAFAYIGKLEFISRMVIVVASGLLTSALLVGRLFLRWWYLWGRQEHRVNYLKVLVIGGGRRALELIQHYKSESEWGIDIVGIVDPEASKMPDTLEGVEILGGVEKIDEILATQVIDEVIVCLPRSLLGKIDPIISACNEQAVCVKYPADIFTLANGSTMHLEAIGKQPILSFDAVHHDEGKLIAKRIMDLLVTIPALLICLPLFGLVVVAIKLESKGPAFFLQDRVGLNKRNFRMIKFRSMYVDAEHQLAQIEHLNEAEGPIFKISNDPRITRVGKFIRRTSIDELPQLINVLLGDMSLVGPRPMSLRDVNMFSLHVQRRRFSVRPGLACLREVSGRSRLSFDEWLYLDLKYIDEWSMWMDIKILFLLVPSVIRGDGAS
jgi:exopolysaccharide biosynthesis polyprenyl glycosylphosphotransferase